MKYNVAIVGCGSMGVEQLFDKTIPFTYSFAGAVFKNPQTQLVALVDTDQTKLGELGARLRREGYASGFGNYGSLEVAAGSCRSVGRPIDIVCCAAGPHVNAHVIRHAKSLGIRGVYCEKPLVLSLAEADELARVEAGTDVKIQVNYLRNYDTHHLAVVDFIRNGGIGELLIVRALYKGGVIAVAPHAMALLNRLFGKPLEVSGCYSPILNTRCLEDPNVDGVIRYRFSPQERDINVSIMATGRGDFKNDTYLFEFEFTGTKGRVSILENGWRVRYERMEPTRVFESLGEIMPYDSARVPLELKADAPREFMIEGLARLVSAIENDTPTNCNVALARDAEEIAHALAIAADKREAISLPLTDRTHAFANAKAGVKSLKEEIGRVIPAKSKGS